MVSLLGDILLTAILQILFREDATVDDLIDVIEGNRKYMKCIYVYNKIDVVGIDDVDRLARQPNSIVISCNLKVGSSLFLVPLSLCRTLVCSSLPPFPLISREKNLSTQLPLKEVKSVTTENVALTAELRQTACENVG